MNELELTLRLVTDADAALLMDWRNDAATRSNSRSGEPVHPDQHNAWLSRVISSTDHVIRIAERRGVPVGVVRADRIEGGWELSWTVSPLSRGKGVGGRMLRTFAAGLDGRLAAVIRSDNHASRRIAETAGFRPTGDSPVSNFELWVRE
jgi:RimJ/RimL family protein N-acetyltransferase